ncbi:MAG: GNAT family N-acetyltransferase [Candidatus Omnitrophota bacterium]
MTDYEGPVSIQDNELEELIGLLNLVFRPHGGDMGENYPRHVGANNLENIRVIKTGGRIMSHVAASVRAVTLGGIATKEAGIGAVATHPDARGKGFASILMIDAVARSVQQGADIMLISGDLGVYRRMNAVDCGVFPCFRLERDDLTITSDFWLEPVNRRNLVDAIALLESASVRYLLPYEDLEALLKSRFVMDKPCDLWIVRRGGEAVGFGAIHHKGSELAILDWAGHPDALQAGAWLWFNEYKAERLTYIPPSVFMAPLAWRPFIRERRCFDGTVLVINAQRFLERARDFLTVRLGEVAMKSLRIEAGEQWARFQLGENAVEFANGGELALLFFGYPTKDILAERIPQKNELYHLLHQAFPVPLVWYGIGYV